MHTDLGLYRRVAREVRPYRLHIAAIFIISMLAAPLALLDARAPGDRGGQRDRLAAAAGLPGRIGAGRG